MTISESQLRATARYHAKKYDTLTIRVAKGKRDEYKDEADKRGLSLATFIKTAVEKYINDTAPIT